MAKRGVVPRHHHRNFALAAVFVFIFLLVGVENADSAHLTRMVNIITPGFFDWNVPVSLSNIGPAFDTGISALRRRYSDFNWSHEFLLSELFRDCSRLTDNVQFVLSRWYYTQRNKDALSVIVTPGMHWSAIFVFHSIIHMRLCVIKRKPYNCLKK